MGDTLSAFEKKRTSRKKTILVLFIILLICWIPYAVMTFPGNMAYDAGTGIAYYLQLDQSNPNNPFFQNVLMGWIYQAGILLGNPSAAIFCWCLVQMILTALLLSCFMVEIGERKGSLKSVLPVMVLYSIIPVFPMSSFTFSKDSSFSLAVLFFIYLLYKAAKAPEEFFGKKSNLILLAISVILVSILRNYTWMMATVPFVLLSILIVRKRLIIFISCITMALSVFLSVFLPGWLGNEKAEIREGMSLPLQTTAYYVINHRDQVTEEQKETINKVVDYQLLSTYDPWIADPIKDQSHFTEETAGAFLKMWMDLFIRDPGTLLKGIWNSTDNYFNPKGLQTLKPHINIGNEISSERKEQLHLDNTNPLLDTVRTIDQFVLDLPFTGLFSRIGIYSWLLIFLTIIILVYKKTRYLLCVFPVWIILLGCMFSPVNGYFRYAYPIILSVPLLTSGIAGEENNRKQRKKTIKSRIRLFTDYIRSKESNVKKICLASAMAISFLLDTSLWYTLDGTFTPSQQGRITEIQNAECVRCEFEDGIYKPVAADPHLVYKLPDLQIRSVAIYLAEPLKQNTDTQVFYSAENEDFNERKSVRQKVPEGTTRIYFSLRDNRSSNLRMDLDGEMRISHLSVSDREVIFSPDSYIPRWIRIIIFFLIMTALFSILFFKPKNADKEYKRE